MTTFSIILPFARHSDEVRESLAALARDASRSAFELLLVWNSRRPMRPDEEDDIRRILAGAAFRILHFPDKLGPSQAWCHGLRHATTDFVCLLAVDAPVAPSWGSAIVCSVAGDADLYQGDYSTPAGDDVWARLESAIDRVRFEDLGMVDFRNAVLRRTAALRLLEEYFGGLFFSDVEIERLRPRLPALAVTKIPAARVVNIYPATLRQCARRKFRHGVCVGRILRCFPATPPAAGPLKTRERSGVSGSNLRFIVRTMALVEGLPAKLALAAMHGIFFAATFLGWALPGSFARRFYTMHFDDQDIARKTSTG